MGSDKKYDHWNRITTKGKVDISHRTNKIYLNDKQKLDIVDHEDSFTHLNDKNTKIDSKLAAKAMKAILGNAKKGNDSTITLQNNEVDWKYNYAFKNTDFDAKQWDHSESTGKANIKDMSRPKGFKKEIDTNNDWNEMIDGESRNFSCKRCNYSATNKPNLSLHVKSVHNNIRDLSCSDCNYSTADSSNLERHIRRRHK